MSITSTTLLSPRQKAKQTGQTYFFHTTDFASGRRLAEPIQEEDEMSDAGASEILSAEDSDTGEYDTDETETPNYRNGHGLGNGNGNGNGQHYSGTAESVRQEDFAEYPSSSSQPKLSSWADLDLSVIIALISPIGQWLTGGDHIKNLFLMVLLVFYLHQLIQVPWELYRASLPRRPASPLPRAKDAKSRLLRLAATELRTHEHMYLLLTVLSPFLGALFLRYTLSAITGADHMSWFSTTLFVLATGTRPWSHLLDRLRTRTTELHDAIHYPSPESAFSAMRKLEVAMKRIDAMERELGEVKGRAAAAPTVGVEVYDDLSGGLEEVEKAVRKGQRKMEATRTAQDQRLEALERNIAFLLEDRLQQRARAIQYGGGGGHGIVSSVLAIPHGIWARVNPFQQQLPGPEPVLSEKQRGKRRLETIPEDPVDFDAPDVRPSSSKTTHPVEFSMTPSPASFFGLALAVLTWPMRIFLATCRSFQRAFFPARHRRHRHLSH